MMHRQKNVTNANFRKTENAAFTASDEQVKVKGFRGNWEKNRLTVETTDGEVVNLADLSFQDEGTQNLFNIASKMDNAAAATALVIITMVRIMPVFMQIISVWHIVWEDWEVSVLIK